MPARTRIRDNRSGHIGSIKYGNGTHYTYSGNTQYGPYWSTSDFTGNRDGVNNFDLYYTFKYGGLINGYQLKPDLITKNWIYESYPMDVTVETIPDPASYFSFDFGRLSNLAWQLLSETNPETPDISVPQFLGELKDLPSLVHGWGRSMIHDVAKSHIVDRWVWRPFVKDLKALLGLQESISNRFKEFERLKQGRKLGRRKSLDNKRRKIEGSPFLAHSLTLLITGRWDLTVSERIWGSVQWYAPSWSWVRSASDDALLKQAKKVALGLTSWNAVATTWELLPWSWLIDWFSNVGQMINAMHNSLDIHYRNVCIMRHLTLSQNFVQTIPFGAQNANVTYTSHRRWKERKLRYANPAMLPFPTFRLPVLTDKKLSIIAALAALRLPQSRKASYLKMSS